MEPGAGDESSLTALVGGINDTAFALHRELADGRNQFVSPLGVALALAMVYPGTSEPARTRLGEMLGSTDDGTPVTALRELRDRLSDRERVVDPSSTAEPSFELAVADAAWGQAGYPFDPAYLGALATLTGDDGGLREVDYGEPGSAREQINTWVAEATDGAVTDLLPPGALDPQTRLVLTTALRFRARWKHPFDGTTARTFTGLDGTDHEVAMFEQRRPWVCAEYDGVQAVELPYAGGDVAMLVVCPPPGEFRAFERRLDADWLGSLVGALEAQSTRLVLPRFEFAWQRDLATPLARLGPAGLFDAETGALDGVADGDERLAVDGVYHETRVAVDAAGTEAAAATGTTIGTVSVQPVETEMVVDSPFVFLIRDRPTGAVLFLGRAVDPTGWG